MSVFTQSNWVRGSSSIIMFNLLFKFLQAVYRSSSLSNAGFRVFLKFFFVFLVAVEKMPKFGSFAQVLALCVFFAIFVVTAD